MTTFMIFQHFALPDTNLAASVSINSAVKVPRLELIVTIKEGFCCDIALLFYGTVFKFLTALIFLKSRLIS